MIEQVETIREALEGADRGYRKALTALTQLEAMVGEQKPVAYAIFAENGNIRLWSTEPQHVKRIAQEKGLSLVPLYAAPPAQQAQRPDFHDEWTGYLKDGETPFERFRRERKDLDALTKLYQRALEENERLKAQQPQARSNDVARTCPFCNEEWVEQQQVEAVPPSNLIDPGSVVSFAVDRWLAEVSNRPLVNKNRRTLDDTWRQVILRFGGDPDVLLGPPHDELVAIAQQKGGV